jgi:hypothetical protein
MPSLLGDATFIEALFVNCIDMLYGGGNAEGFG